MHMLLRSVGLGKVAFPQIRRRFSQRSLTSLELVRTDLL
jgi:hypothetical protein